MHNWRLLILLIPSLLQPILSEHNFIYGRQYCIHSSRSSLEDQRFFNRKKPTCDGLHLDGQQRTGQFEIRRSRYDIKDVKPTPLSREQDFERDTFRSDGRSPIVHIRRHRTVNDINRNVQSQIVHEENHKNSLTRNARNTVTALYARFPHEDRERKTRDHAEHRFDTQLDTRRSHLRDARQEISQRVVDSNTIRKNNADVVRQNFRHDQPLSRQYYRKLRFQVTLPQERNIVDSLERIVRKRDLNRDSLRDARTETPIDVQRELVTILRNERNTRQQDTDRRNRNIVHRESKINSHTRNKLDNPNENERYSRDDVRERTSVSMELPSIRQSGVKQINDRQIISNRDSASPSLERDNRRSESRDVFYSSTSVRNIRNLMRSAERNSRDVRQTTEIYVLRTDPTDKRNDERHSKLISRERVVSGQRYISQSDERMRDVRGIPIHEEMNRNKRDLRTYTQIENMHSRNLIRERGDSLEHDRQRSDARVIDTHNARKREVRTDLKNKRTDVRNTERYERDNLRDDALYDETRRYDARRTVTGMNNITPNQAESDYNFEHERTDTRNTGRDSRDINSHRSISFDREVRKSDTKMVIDISVAQSRNERNTNIRVERSRIRNNERYSRERIRERAVSDERDVRKRQSSRASDIHTARSREELNTGLRFDRTAVKNGQRDTRRVRDVSITDYVHRQGARKPMNIYIDYTRKERNTNVRGNIYVTSLPVERSHVSEREILRSDFIPNRERDNRNMKNIRSDIRQDERYYREKVLHEREIRSDLRKEADENDAIKHDERNTRVVDRAVVGHVGRYVNDNIRERTLFFNRAARQQGMQRFTDRHLTYTRNERNTDVGRESTDIRYAGRYSKDNTRDRSVSVNREVRESDVRRVVDVQNHGSREERNVRNKRSDIRNDERYSRYVTREKAVLIELFEDRRQPFTMRIDDRQIKRDREVQNLNVRKERSDVRYVRNDRIRDRTAHFNNREHLEINGRKIFRNQITMNDVDKRSKMRKSEGNLRDLERITITTDGSPGVMTSNERRTARTQIREKDTLVTYPRFMRIDRTSQEQIRKRDYVGSSDSRVSESRTKAVVRSSISDLNRERETRIRKGYRSSETDVRRDYGSTQNSELTNALRTMTRNAPTESVTKPTETQFNALFYWQYIFYAVQGIYILGVLIKVFKENECSKTSSTGWLNPTRLIKVD